MNTRLRTLLISFCTVQLQTFCAAYSLATLSFSLTSGPDPEELPGFWGSMVFHHVPFLGRGQVITTIFSVSDFPLCDPYAHIIRISSLPKVSTIVITMLLFLLTFTTFPDVSSSKFQPLQILHHFLTTTVHILCLEVLIKTMHDIL